MFSPCGNRLPERLCRLSNPNRIRLQCMDSNLKDASKERRANPQDTHNERLTHFESAFYVSSAFWSRAFDPLKKLFPFENIALRSTLPSLGSAYGDRTRISALRGPCPNRLDERANGPRMYRAHK
jgi:hypothetical protein